MISEAAAVDKCFPCLRIHLETAALATQLYIPQQLLQNSPFHGALGFLKALLCFFSYPQSPVNTIFFPEDLTLFFGVRAPEQEAKGRKDVFSKSGFWLREVPLGREERLLEKGGSEQAPKFSPFDLPRKAGEIWGFLWDTILSRAKPSAWHRGLARGSWLGGKLIPLMEHQGRSSCIAEVFFCLLFPQRSRRNRRAESPSVGRALTAPATPTCWCTDCRPVRNPSQSRCQVSALGIQLLLQCSTWARRRNFAGCPILGLPLCFGSRLGELEKAPGRS